VNTASWEQARRHLTEILRDQTGAGLLRAEVPLDGAPAMTAWLGSRPAWPRIAWSSRDRSFRAAAAGSLFPWQTGTDPQKTLTEAARMLETAPPGTRVYVGSAFAPDGGTAPEWAGFGAGWAVFPRVELTERDGYWHLATSARANHLDQDLAALDALLAPPPDTAALAMPRRARPLRDDCPGREAWVDAVREVTWAIGAGDLQKAVLARRTNYAFETPLPPLALFGALSAHGGLAFCHLFQPAEHAAWVGASPELLFRRDGATLVSEALAGTRPRHDDPALDAVLRDALLASDKDRREHALVDAAIREAFGRVCASMDAPGPPEVVSPGRCHHLRTRVSGRLRAGLNDADLITALHPTPAVGGTPPGEARRLIARLDPFDRGWYTGPVGWWSRDASETAVGIRSALVRDNTLSVYCGAGIVAGSDPDAEWEELDHKLRSFLACAGLGAEDP
jgi:menaquinone-specific isochorismate synthase